MAKTRDFSLILNSHKCWIPKTSQEYILWPDAGQVKAAHQLSTAFHCTGTCYHAGLVTLARHHIVVNELKSTFIQLLLLAWGIQVSFFSKASCVTDNILGSMSTPCARLSRQGRSCWQCTQRSDIVCWHFSYIGILMLDLRPYVKGKHGQAVICENDLAIHRETWSRAYRSGTRRWIQNDCLLLHNAWNRSIKWC